MQTLVRHPGFFKAAICLYGISNLFTLAATTHKFEAHYLDSLIGPLPEAAALYRERSPLFAADRLRDPIALFQGRSIRLCPRPRRMPLWRPSKAVVCHTSITSTPGKDTAGARRKPLRTFIQPWTPFSASTSCLPSEGVPPYA